MDNKVLLAYLNEFKSELQEMSEDFDSELSHNENDGLYHDAYELVGTQLEEAITGIESLIGEIEEGKYDDFDSEDIDYQEYGGSE